MDVRRTERAGHGGDARTVRPEEVSDVTDLLHVAFRDDPVSRWVFPDEGHREAAHPRLFGTFLAMSARHGTAELAADARAVALWFRSSGGELTGGDELDEALGRVDPGNVRLPALGEATGDHHPTADHAYLQAIAVHPEDQGRGLGGRLLRRALDRCDREGLPAYLEASNEHSRGIYLHYGFVETSAPVRLPFGGPPMWPMWREPKGG
nr:GNAT family N-acetyltransferase [Streptomyces sulphureus]